MCPSGRTHVVAGLAVLSLSVSTDGGRGREARLAGDGGADVTRVDEGALARVVKQPAELKRVSPAEEVRRLVRKRVPQRVRVGGDGGVGGAQQAVGRARGREQALPPRARACVGRHTFEAVELALTQLGVDRRCRLRRHLLSAQATRGRGLGDQQNYTRWKAREMEQKGMSVEYRQAGVGVRE
eukprot:4666459-Pleurochrysis_carterae.AAC.1